VGGVVSVGAAGVGGGIPLGGRVSSRS